jgi:hypothetical protein
MTKGWRRVKADRRQGGGIANPLQDLPHGLQSAARTPIQRHHILAVDLVGIKMRKVYEKTLAKRWGVRRLLLVRVAGVVMQASEKPQQKRL